MPRSLSNMVSGVKAMAMTNGTRIPVDNRIPVHGEHPYIRVPLEQMRLASWVNAANADTNNQGRSWMPMFIAGGIMVAGAAVGIGLGMLGSSHAIGNLTSSARGKELVTTFQSAKRNGKSDNHAAQDVIFAGGHDFDAIAWALRQITKENGASGSDVFNAVKQFKPFSAWLVQRFR